MTANQAGDLTALLERLAQSPAPPSGIDIGRARAVGRRRLRRRRVIVASTIAILVLAATVAPALVSARVGHGPPTATIGSGADPVIAKATFGWLPDSIAGVGYTVGDHGTNTVAVGPPVPGATNAHVYLSVYPPGTAPTLTGAQVKVPAPPVNGSPAYWVTGNPSDHTNGGNPILLWQTGTGQWVNLFAGVLPAADLDGTVLRIAAGVTVRDTAVPLPLYFTGLPTSFQLTDALLSRPSADAPWRLQLTYRVDGSYVTIDVSPAGGSRRAGGDSCGSAKGLDLCILLPGGAPPPGLVAIGGVAGLRNRITLLGTNEHNWTTNVLR